MKIFALPLKLTVSFATAFALFGLNACSDDSSTSIKLEDENIVESSDDHDEDDEYSGEAEEGDIVSSSSSKAKSSSSSRKQTDDETEDSSSSAGEEKPSSDSKLKVELFEKKGGFYPDAITIHLSAAASSGDVHCTFDGSAPTENSPSFEERTISQNTVVRCNLYKNDELVGTSTETYFIGETVKMPVVAVSVSPEFFARNYVYDRSCEGSDPAFCRGNLMEDIEYPVHVEYFAEGSSSKEKAWEIDAGISLMGQWSRTYPKKSVSISMREKYEEGRLKYPLFTTRPEAKKFKAFNLRNNGNRFVNDYIEDAMASSLLEGSGVDYQRSRQVVVFYNGTYYGIHDMREKMNRHFVETNYGIDSKGVEMIKHVDETITASGEEGTTDGYIQLLDFIYANDFSGSNNKNFEVLKTMMDVGNYADYIAAQIYYRNGDWPNNNVRAWRSAEQPWKFMVFDLDHGFGWDWCVGGFDYYYPANGESMFDWIRSGGKKPGMMDKKTPPCAKNPSAKCFHTIFVKLMENNDFKRMLANHAAVMYDYYMNSKTVQVAVSTMMNSIDASEMSRDMAKYPRQYGQIFDQTGNSFVSWASVRDASIWNEYIDEFDLDEPITVTIKSSGSGIVLLDGMKLPGKATSTNYTGKFFGGNKMELTAVPTGSAVFAGWEDGSKDNPRIVSPTDNKVYGAQFK